ncbi:MAG: hypothetical protein OEV76_05135 [Anaerolineae bacterium]|nr:hypothetical protein [Anaerolineae bacterium]
MYLSDEVNEDSHLEELDREVTGLFPPVRPLPAHRQRLREGLVDTMRNRGSVRIVSPFEQRRLAFIAGAAVGLALSLFGLLAYLLYSRCLHKPGHSMPQ